MNDKAAGGPKLQYQVKEKKREKKKKEREKQRRPHSRAKWIVYKSTNAGVNGIIDLPLFEEGTRNN